MKWSNKVLCIVSLFIINSLSARPMGGGVTPARPKPVPVKPTPAKPAPVEPVDQDVNYNAFMKSFRQQILMPNGRVNPAWVNGAALALRKDGYIQADVKNKIENEIKHQAALSFTSSSVNEFLDDFYSQWERGGFGGTPLSDDTNALSSLNSVIANLDKSAIFNLNNIKVLTSILTTLFQMSKELASETLLTALQTQFQLDARDTRRVNDLITQALK